MRNSLRIGTRESALALWQASYIQKQLTQLGFNSQLIPLKSTGDLNLVKPLYEMGVVGMFTKELDKALLNGTIDIAVHSMKDVPIVLPKGLKKIFVPKRGLSSDILVAKNPISSKAVIATSSLRRKAQWLNRYPNHIIENLRGNVQTRLQKLTDSHWDGAIFAAAGLDRLNIKPENTTNLEWMIPAPAQGALMVVARDDNQQWMKKLNALSDADTERCVLEERCFLRTLEGGCTAPIGAHAKINQGLIHFEGCITRLDGSKHVVVKQSFTLETKYIGEKAAHVLLDKGGDKIIQDLTLTP